MSRIARSRPSAVALAALAALALAAVPAAAHEGDARYRSVVQQIVPPLDGLSATVLDHDDALQLVNESDEDVVVLDEDGEPFARLHADGTVQVNRASSLAREERGGDDTASTPRLYASVDVGPLLAHGGEEHAPGEEHAAPRAAPRTAWTTVDRTGRYTWHDPRISYREQGVPPQVTDETRETKVKDWRIPLLVSGEAGDVIGTLTWVGEPGAGSSFPTAAVVSLVVLGLLGLAAVVLVRRRRPGESAS